MNPHPSNCDCLKKIFRVVCAKPKETLTLFGGKTSLTDYRKDFLMITNYQWVLRYFNDKTNIASTFQSLISNPLQRVWVYYNFDDDEMQHEDHHRTEEKKEMTPPVVKTKRKPKLFY